MSHTMKICDKIVDNCDTRKESIRIGKGQNFGLVSPSRHFRVISLYQENEAEEKASETIMLVENAQIQNEVSFVIENINCRIKLIVNVAIADQDRRLRRHNFSFDRVIGHLYIYRNHRSTGLIHKRTSRYTLHPYQQRHEPNKHQSKCRVGLLCSEQL